MVNWDDIDKRLEVAAPFVLTDEEVKRVARAEQEAFDRNLPRIRGLLERHRAELVARGFWTELLAESKGLRFRYSKLGFYGPGGFSSQFHVAGPLVLARIDPKGDPVAAFYGNDLDSNVFLGDGFDEVTFTTFVRDDLVSYIAPENQILSPHQYTWVKSLLERRLRS